VSALALPKEQPTISLKVERRIKMDTGKETDTSIGKKSTETPTLAKEKGKAVNPSIHAQTKDENSNTLETLAELLSLIQEDCRRYDETLAGSMHVVIMADKFSGGIAIFIPSPYAHKMDTGNGHILLDGKPVTGWKE